MSGTYRGGLYMFLGESLCQASFRWSTADVGEGGGWKQCIYCRAKWLSGKGWKCCSYITLDLWNVCTKHKWNSVWSCWNIEIILSMNKSFKEHVPFRYHTWHVGSKRDGLTVGLSVSGVSTEQLCQPKCLRPNYDVWLCVRLMGSFNLRLGLDRAENIITEEGRGNAAPPLTTQPRCVKPEWHKADIKRPVTKLGSKAVPHLIPNTLCINSFSVLLLSEMSNCKAFYYLNGETVS